MVCADKTGTLTENGWLPRSSTAAGECCGSAARRWRRSGFEQDGRTGPAARRSATAAGLLVGVLCSDAELEIGSNGELVIDGSATEGALQVAAVKAGLETADLRERYPRLDLRDRSDGRRHMVTVHRLDDELVALMKGSPEEVLDLCDSELGPDGTTRAQRGRSARDWPGQRRHGRAGDAGARAGARDAAGGLRAG